MKKISAILSFTALLLCGCTVTELNGGRLGSPVFTASFEEMPGTKTYVDSDLYMYWNADDRLSIFTTTYNQQYRFSGKTGDNGGDFEEVAGGFHSGNSISTNYAVYPYSSTTSLTKDEKISLTMPAVQDYAEGSFGLGASTMVAVTAGPSDYFLAFKNLCGFLVVKLYGEGSVKSVSIKGNNGEKLAGPATVTASHGSAPSLEFGADATETITIDCGAGITLGTDASHATEFWFCIPPVSFSKGFTITATNTEGWSMVKSTSKSREVERNIKTGMAALPAVFDTKLGNIEFEDANFKAYCVENFDKDGDGEISYEEAEKVKSITVDGGVMKSLKGIEYFTQLKYLDCSLKWSSLQYDNEGKTHWYDSTGNEVFSQLTSLDISKNTALTRLYCAKNQLTSLDVSSNTALETLSCPDNLLTSLDVSNNTSLTNLSCERNLLTALYVSKNTGLTYLDCGSNRLASLDVSNITALETLRCLDNLLTSLDVSNNTSLVDLTCYINQLTTLDVSNNTALTWLSCGSNRLVSLDVSNITALETLHCPDNLLTYLNVSNNTALTNLSCDRNLLTALDVSKNTGLTYLDCSAMSTLETLYIAQGQYIPNVTENRNISFIPKQTEIVVVGVPQIVDLGLSIKWSSINVGAKVPWEYGDYYAWGETETKNEYAWSTYFDSIDGSDSNFTEYYKGGNGKTVLDLEDDAAHVKFGGKWRMPTAAEIDELIENCQCDWVTFMGVKGIKFTSKISGYTNKWIFLPAAGRRYFTTTYSAGTYGDYWSSSLNDMNDRYSFEFNLDSGESSYDRCAGQSVRPVCE